MPNFETVLTNQVANAAAKTALDLQGLVQSMASQGMTGNQIKQALMRDIINGGPLFAGFRSSVRNITKNGVEWASNFAQKQVYLANDVEDLTWQTASDGKECPDCRIRHGEDGTMDYWLTVGIPKSGFSVCTQHCRCVLIPQGAEAKLARPLRRKKPKNILDPKMVGKHTKIRDAEMWAEKNYPEIVWDFKDAHIDTINPTLVEFTRLAQQYPEVANRLRYVGTYRNKAKMSQLAKAGVRKFEQKEWYPRMKMWAGEYAHAAKSGEYIALNPKFYRNKALLERSLKRCTKKELDGSTFHPPGCDTIESIFTHEFGHQVQNWIESLSDDIAFTKAVSMSDDFGIVKNTFRNWYGMHINEAGRDALRAISRYSLERKSIGDFSEAWAEGFASTVHTPVALQAEVTKKISEFLNKFMADRDKWTDNWKFIRDIPDQEVRKAMILELQELRHDLGMGKTALEKYLAGPTKMDW